MPENLIHSSDIFDAGLPGSLQEVTDLLVKLRNELSQTAGEIRGSGSGSAQGVKELVNVANALNDAFKATNNALAVNNDALAKYTAALEANARAKQKNAADTKGLTDAEAREVEFLSQSLNFLTQNGNRNMNVWKNITQAMSGTNMSYNQMKATVQVLEKALRSLSNSWEKESAGAKSAQAAVVRLKEAMKGFDDATKATATSTGRAVGASREYKKLTDEEAASVNAFKAALAGSNQERIDAVKNVDMEAKSYNELYALYSAVKEELKSMTKEEVENTEAGKQMVLQSRRWMEHLNNFQKATGNFSLNVGNYSSAFDGLGYSIQQVMREVPSAQNINQFFLAISNNIPIVADQIKEFKRDQEGIAEDLEKLQEGTEEYMELQAKQMSLGTKLIKSVLNWQSAILLVLLALRNYDKILNFIRNLWDKITGAVINYSNAVKAAALRVQVMADAMKAVSSDVVELRLLNEELSKAEKGTDAWKNAIDRVNEITKKNLDATTATVKQIDEATKAYIRQARQIAINNKVVERLAEFDLERMKKSSVKNSKTPTLLSGFIGDDKEREKFEENAKSYEQKLQKFRNSKKELDDFLNNDEYMTAVNRGNDLMKRRLDALEVTYSDAEKAAIKAEREWHDYLDEVFKTGNSDEYKALMDMYKGVGQKDDKSNKGKKSNDPTLEAMNDRYWEMMEARAKMIEDEYKKEVELANVTNARLLEENEDAWDEQVTALDNNLREGFITREEYNTKILEAKQQHDAIEEALEKEHTDNLRQIWEKYELKRIQAEIKETEVTTEQVMRRVRTRAAEAARNAQVNRNIERLKNQLMELERIDTKGVEEGEKAKQEAIEKTTAAIEKQRQALDYSQKLKAATNIFDVFGVSDRLQDFAGSGDKRGLMESILGDSLGNASDEQVNDYFEKWFDAAEKAVGEWYNSTTKYISEALDAYVRLAEAKAELAQQDTENAQEAYEKEKALLEAGYANRMSAAWEEYQQKKALQKQAEEDAKKAAKVQMDLDTAQQGASLVTAIANLYKVLSGINIPFPGAGVALATGLSAALLTAFGEAKVKAYQLAKYGSGGYEEVTEGGTHASGHDTMLGIRNRRGRQMVVERGEGIGVFTRAARARYGSRGLKNLVDAANRGQIGTMALAELERDRAGGVQQTFVSAVNLGKIERALETIERQGSVRYGVDSEGNMVEYRGRTKTTYKK